MKRHCCIDSLNYGIDAGIWFRKFYEFTQDEVYTQITVRQKIIKFRDNQIEISKSYAELLLEGNILKHHLVHKKPLDKLL